MNFVWLDINASWSHSSLALPALHANLAKQTQDECNMQVVSGTIKSGIPQILEELQAKEPQYIFATAWLFNIDYLNQILSRISSLCPIKGIFLGGPEFLGNNRDFLESHRYVTAVFKGEGEETFEPFIRSLLNEDNRWKQLPGFEWVENGSYLSSRSITVKEFTALQPPEISPMFRWDKQFVQLETSRGCFNNCRFCVSGIEKAAQQNIPIAELRRRLQNIASKGIRQVRVLDRTFNGNPKRALELLDLFNEFAGRLNFHLEVHPALLFPPDKSFQACHLPVQADNTLKSCSPGEISSAQAGESPVGNTESPANITESPVGKLRRRLAEMPKGLLHIEAGIQSLRQQVLDNCSRAGSSDSAIKGLEYLAGISSFDVHADLIAGLPGYTWKELLQDAASLMEIGPAEIQLESLKLLPGTYFRNNATELGIKFSPVPPYEVLSTPHISYKELGRAMTLSKIIDLWYNDPKWRETFREIITAEKGVLERLVEDLAGTEILTQPLSLESKGILLYRFCKTHTPEKAPLISLQWVRNGLSIKKEPAERFIRWDMNGNGPANPLFIENDPRYKYWYIEIGETRHWFSFNKEVERVAPCNYITEEI